MIPPPPLGIKNATIQDFEERTGKLKNGKLGTLTSKPKQVLFFFLPQKFCGNPAEEFCYFDGRSGLPSLCISAMILVAWQNNSLIDVLCNREYFLFVKLIFCLK